MSDKRNSSCEPSSPTSATNPLSPGYVGMGRLLETGAFSDVSLFVGPTKKQFRVHKGILSQNSSYFSRIFQSEGFREAKENEVHLPEHEWNILEKVLVWLYTSSPFKQIGRQKPYFIDICAKIFTYSTYFDIPSLKPRAIDLCVSCLEEQRYHAGREYNDRFVEAAKILFEAYSTTEGTHVEPFLVAVSTKHFLSTVLASDDLRAMLWEEPELMMKLLEAKSETCVGCVGAVVDSPTV